MADVEFGEWNAQEADRRAQYAKTVESGRLGDPEMDDVSADEASFGAQE